MATAVAGALTVGVLGVPALATPGLPASRTAQTAAAGLVGSHPLAADDLKDKKRRAEKKVRRAQSDLHASSRRMQKASTALARARQQLAGAKVELAAAEARVSRAAARDARMQAELDEAKAALAQAQADLAAGQQQRADQRDEVAATIADIYQQGDPELMAFASLLDAKTPADLTRQTEMRDAIVDRESRFYQELQASEVLLQVREDQVEAAKKAVAAKRQEAAEHLVEMQAYEAQAAEAKASVAALVGSRRTARAVAARARRADEAALAQAKRQEAQIAEMLRRRALAALRRKKSGPPGNSGGFLNPPVSGARLSSPYGYRHHPIYGYWGLHDGQDWAADCGSPLYAGANGKVVSSYFSAVYGRRLVIDHGVAAGRGLATVYNHATRYTVGVGARVTRGQVIGYVGSTGWSTGCHLHFTVMANGRTVDPRGWL